MSRVAYIFPGQGSQQQGMCRALAQVSSAARAVFDAADAALEAPLSQWIDEGPADLLSRTEITQPAVLTASIAALQALREAGAPPPHVVAGHSLGEWSALVCAGVLTLPDAVRLVQRRGRLMQEAVPAGVGAMSAVLQLEARSVEAACAHAMQLLPGRVVAVANDNGPGQTVIAGHREAVEKASELCKAAGARRVVPLDVSAPFHSPLMRPVVDPLSAHTRAVVWSDARVPVVTNVHAAPETRGESLHQSILDQVASPVRWTEVVAQLATMGVRTFVELGPGTVLAGLVRRQVPDAQAFSVSTPDHVAAVVSALRAAA